MSLLFHVLSRLVRAFLPRSERLLISWLQSLVRHCKQKGGQGQVFVSCRIPVRSPAPAPLFRPRVGPASIRDPPPPGLWRLYGGRQRGSVPLQRGTRCPAAGAQRAARLQPSAPAGSALLVVTPFPTSPHPGTNGLGIKHPAILTQGRTLWWATLQTWLRFWRVCVTGQFLPPPSCFSFPSQGLTSGEHRELRPMPKCALPENPAWAHGFLWGSSPLPLSSTQIMYCPCNQFTASAV